MKKIGKKLLILGLLSTLMVSCGGKNSSGGSGSAGSNADHIQDNGDWNSESQGNSPSQGMVDISVVQREFNQKSFTDGLSNGAFIYHIGPYYSANNNSNQRNFGFKISGCLRLFFRQIGNCNGANGLGHQAYLESILQRGKLKVITGTSSENVSYKTAQSAGAYDFIYDAGNVISRSSNIYREMLGGSAHTSYNSKVIASYAYVELENGQRVKAYHIEIFTAFAVKRYVVSPQLPIVANPIAILDDSGTFLGALKSVGDVKIRRIQVQGHKIGYGSNYVEPEGYARINL